MPAVTGAPAPTKTVRIRTSHWEHLVAFRETLQIILKAVTVTSPDSISTSQPLKATKLRAEKVLQRLRQMLNMWLSTDGFKANQIWSFRFPFSEESDCQKKKTKSWRFSKFRYDPPVLLFWSVTIRSAVQQTFSYSPSKRRARQKAHQSSDSCPMSSLFLATGGVFLLQRVPCAVVQSLSPAHRFLHTPSDIPLALSFPSLSPFKQDSNSSTQVLSTLLLLFLHRHLLLF